MENHPQIMTLVFEPHSRIRNSVPLRSNAQLSTCCWTSTVKIDRSVNPALASSLGGGAASHDLLTTTMKVKSWGHTCRPIFNISNTYTASENAFPILEYKVMHRTRWKCSGFRDEMAREARRLRSRRKRREAPSMQRRRQLSTPVFGWLYSASWKKPTPANNSTRPWEWRFSVKTA